MATKRKAPEPIGDPNDPQGMAVMLARFVTVHEFPIDLPSVFDFA